MVDVFEAVMEKISADSPTFWMKRFSVLISPSCNVISKDVGEISMSGMLNGVGVIVGVGVGV